MKYLQLKMNTHLAIPVKLMFKKALPSVNPTTNIFDNQEYKVECQMLSADGYKTAPNKEGTSFDILVGDTFEFTMSVTLFKRCLEYYKNEKQVYEIEMMKNETGKVQYIINTDEDISGETVIPASNEATWTFGDDDSKWDEINRKKREEIAHGQAYNIATSTVNISNPTLSSTDLEEWLRKVVKIVETIKPKLVEPLPFTKTSGSLTITSDNLVVKNEEKEDDLPF